MRRIHAIEIHEQDWCPATLRDAATDYLQFTANVGNTYAGIVPRLREAMRATGSRQVLDLCSGAGGPWSRLRDALSEGLEQPLRVRLTDLHPNRVALRRLERDARVEFEIQPVSATQVPEDLPGFRTLFGAFHHFRPRDARAILQDAARRGRGIAVFEPVERSALAILAISFAPLIALLVTPFIRPFRWSRLLWTYLVPLLPPLILFDGIVSCLRTYSPDELRELVAGVDAPDYVWEIGTAPVRGSPLPVTYLIGVPRRDPVRASG